jgi:hypothetical protein
MHVATAMWPPMSLIPLLLLIAAKPIIDAAYQEDIIKYLFMMTLLCASFLAWCGQVLGGENLRREPSKAQFFWFTGTYFIYLYGLMIAGGGQVHEIFKIISPFVFFALTSFAASRWMASALAASATLVIIGNAALIPFDYGWTMWGAVHTFRGFYYFKTDLAYSLAFAILIIAIHSRYLVTPWLAFLTIIATVQVVLANSRLNYITFFGVIAFVAVKSGISWRALIRNSLLVAVVAMIAALLYDPSRLLGFDTSNIAALTQGREATWIRLIDSLGNATIQEWGFGHGMFADLLLSHQAPGRGDAYDAHNEYLHLIYTQGIVGAVLYGSLWGWSFKLTNRSGISPWLRGTGIAAFLFFSLQGTTAVVSSFASKTWPLVMVLLMIKSVSDIDASAAPSTPCTE